MSACAYRLGMAFGREAERTEDAGRRLEMFQLFDRCFIAARAPRHRAAAPVKPPHPLIPAKAGTQAESEEGPRS